MKKIQDYKPSEFIEKSIEDLDSIVALGIHINMSDWFDYDNGECAVCLGGAVLAGMDEEIKINLSRYNIIKCRALMRVNDEYQQIAALFDAIRRGDTHATVRRMKYLWEINQTHLAIEDFLLENWENMAFTGTLDYNELDHLKYCIRSLAIALRSINL